MLGLRKWNSVGLAHLVPSVKQDRDQNLLQILYCRSAKQKTTVDWPSSDTPWFKQAMIHVNLPAMNIADQPCRYWKWNNMKTMVVLVKTPTHFYSFQPVWHSKSLTLLQVPLTPSAPQLNPWETMDDLASSLAWYCWWTKSQTTTWDG